jgi:outer membrane protein assembly factor BamB
MVSDEKCLPESFDLPSGKNIKWAVPLGTETYSSPVIAGGRVFVGTNNNGPRDPRHVGDRGVLMCLDEKDGSLVWQLVAPKRDLEQFMDHPNTGMCSPPTVEGERVYTVTNRGEVVCLDIHGLANGNDGPYQDEGKHMVLAGKTPLEPGKLDADIIWLYDMFEDCKLRQHDSAHCSILIHGQFLYVNTSTGTDATHRKIRNPEAPNLIVVDKATGRLLARDKEPIGPRIFHCTWSSPALGEVNGKTQVFFAGGDGVIYAFESLEKAPPEGTIETLQCVWKFDCDPAAPKENVHQFITNRKESPSSISGMPVFVNNRVHVTAGGDIWWGKPWSWLKCMDATKTGDITKTGEVWSLQMQGHCISTPAIRDGLAFIGTCGKELHCVDAETGKPFWTHATKGDFWGSPLIADGKVYAGTRMRQGEFLIFAAAKEKKLLFETTLDSPMSSTPVAANGVLYVSSMRKLYAVQAK